MYASPSRRDMESKGTEEKITYPNIYFTVDNFEDVRFILKEFYIHSQLFISLDFL